MTLLDMSHSGSSSPSPPTSPNSQQAQNRILNRVSTLFSGKKRANGASEATHASSSSSAAPNEQQDDASQVDSMFHEDCTSSCVDSMYSSIQSRRSNFRPNPNLPPPLRTVQLDNPIVHLPAPPTTPPLNPPIESSLPSPPSPVVDQKKKSHQKVEDIEAQFKLLLKEYAPSADHVNNVNNLTFEQKEMLLRSSRSPALLKKNSTFSHVMPSFSLKATFGIKNKSKHRSMGHDASLSQSPFVADVQNSMSYGGASADKLIQSVKANTAPGRYGRSRSALPGSGHESYGRSTSRSKLKSTPEYFVHLLQETHVRDLEDSEVLDLRVFLRSVVVSWTSEFLAQGGYEAIANLFKQMKEAPKRHPNDNRMLQHLGKCLKTIMTHQSMGTQIVLTNPSALYHIRDILFGPVNKKQKQVYGLEISTRSLLLNLLCTLATLQTSPSDKVEYVHGYDVLRRLLLDRPADRAEDQDKKGGASKLTSPFPISLKTDPKEILQMIMDNDPNGKTIGQEYEWDPDELMPRYTAWMRELQYTVEKHIETITFLAQVLNYDFNSAYRQIKMRQNQAEDETNEAEASGAVMTEEGVVDYIVTHLRLIRTVVTTQPTSYTGHYDEREQEKMRLELMLSGFDKISKILIQCPHPTVRGSYINYLKPLMSPCADLSVPSTASSSTPPPLPTRRNHEDLTHSYVSDDDEDNYEISVYADDEDLNTEHAERQWQYEEEPYYDDIFQDTEEESEASVINTGYHSHQILAPVDK
ncbi:armadillo-type protein [Gilbertella persicaria]|uniref:armadillo-type protein n=1 Tax=Gilbertella persicaria TaxID=101096 RepID=UPI00221FE784|nr:armadillo-type protein [Gilbertella persicaria]KAI8066237.1 armadillo-type protein [Gilbertella persicaria]